MSDEEAEQIGAWVMWALLNSEVIIINPNGELLVGMEMPL